MPRDTKLLEQLIPIFKAEAQDILQALNRDLLALEKLPETEERTKRLADIFRAAHNLKGSARSVGYTGVGTLAHTLETLFAGMQRDPIRATPEHFDGVFEALDLIAALVDNPEERAAQVSAMNSRLEELLSKGAESESLPAFALAPVEPLASMPIRVPVESQQPAGSDNPRSVSPPASPPGPGNTIELPADELVRVAVGKLDALLDQIGELQVTRIGADQRLVEMRDLVEQVDAWETTWRRVRTAYKRSLALFEAEQKRSASESSVMADLDVLFRFFEDNASRLQGARIKIAGMHHAMEADSRRMAQVTSDLQKDVLRTRMLPASVVFDTFPRMVRDLARTCGKEVDLVVEGGGTEMDRSTLEQIKAPIMHLLRNSVDHGTESPDERTRAGKPRQGRITLSAWQRGDSIVVQVADDGAGIDPARVKASALNKGLVLPETAQALGDREAMWLVFRTGISTQTMITDISGRGIGMDVVRETIERLQGVIELESKIGKGTQVTLHLPLTVATTLCLLAKAGDATIAIPLMNVAHVVRLGPEETGLALGRRFIADDGHPVVLVSLADVMGLDPARAQKAGQKKRAIILGAAEKRAAFLVDEIISSQEIVVKSLPRPFLRVRHISGAAILGTGQAVAVLNAADLLRSATSVTPCAESKASSAAATPQAAAVILVADDSITTRTLEKNILEAAGYSVRVAADGAEAWSLLQSAGVAPDGAISLLVSDVQMPGLNGFELTTRIRASARFKDLPVILVTALGSPADRARGIQVGADAYIAKNVFDQDSLLTTIQQLI